MKIFKKNNSGFTLIELIIAMAVLAFLMTAIASLMGSSVASHKKQKAEIRVHTSAQETYNQITDSIMQAKEVVIVGYESSTEYSFSKAGVDVGSTPQLVYYVKNSEMREFIKNNPSVYGTDGAASVGDINIKLFTEFDNSKYFYVKKIAIMTSVPLDMSMVPASVIKDNATDKYVLYDQLAELASNEVTVKKELTASGLNALGANDNVVHIYTFDGANMYYEKQYSFMTTQNDMISGTDKDNWLYNTSLSYVKTSDTTPVDISGCRVTIDANNGAVGVDLMFNDLNMTYTTKGMVNIRNSFVLKGRKD
ncbi:MAG: type II secretion system protein [Lachnospiraceae bacterium]|nr:type II secretion system protein [Lachnospiraceae bacterium]